MLLAASRFSSTLWKREAIDRVHQLSQGESDAYLKVCLAHRESSLLRIRGKRASSNQTLEESIQSTILPGYDQLLEGDGRWNAQRGELVLSFAENLIESGALMAARYELLQWKPIKPRSPSSMERIVLRGRNITLGKTLKFQGYFQAAVDVLDAVLQDSKIDGFYGGTGWRLITFGANKNTEGANVGLNDSRLGWHTLRAVNSYCTSLPGPQIPRIVSHANKTAS